MSTKFIHPMTIELTLDEVRMLVEGYHTQLGEVIDETLTNCEVGNWPDADAAMGAMAEASGKILELTRVFRSMCEAEIEDEDDDGS